MMNQLRRFVVLTYFLLLSFISLSAANLKSNNTEITKTAERRLLDKLMENYDPRVRPVKFTKDVVKVNFSLILQQIVDLDEKNQVLTTSMYMDWQWYDAFLQWDPNDYEGVENLTIPAKNAWKPDILIYNSAVSSFDQMLQTNVILNYKGLVKWLPPGLFQTTCDVDIRFFPYDEQKCQIKFGAWTYHGGLVDLILTSETATTDNFTPNGEFKYISMKGKRTAFYYKCCPNNPFVDITYTVHIKRRILFYGFNLILPCLLICSLTILVFVLPADAGERITLSITILLALVVFLQLVTDSLPPADNIPLLVKFFACSIIMVTLSVIATVISLNFHHTSSANTDEMPKYIRWTFLYFLPKILFMKRPGEHSYRRQFLDSPETNESSWDEHNGEVALVGKRVEHYELAGKQISGETVLDDAHKEMSNILEEVKFITNRMHSDDKDEKSALEWQFAATVLDKFCLYFFTMYLIIATLATLVIGQSAST